MTQPFDRERIKREALAAAERGEGPEACPYGAGSDAGIVWRDFFYAALGLAVIRGAA